MSHFFNRRFHKKGYINNFFVVGAPNIINGNIVSGFSTSNYLTLPQNFIPNSTDFECVFKLKTSGHTQQWFFNTSPWYSFLGGIHSSGVLNIYLSSNASSWNVVSDLKGKTVLDLNTWYYVKYTYDGETYNVYLSKDKVDWNLEISLNSTLSPGVGTSNGRIGCGWTDSAAINTTIDLSECYIKINGEYFWQPYKRCKYDYNFTRVGTPSISNPPSCEVSGFSTSNYITKALTFDINGDWEFITKTYLNAINASTSPTQMLFGITKGTTFGINFYISSVAVKLAFNHTPNIGWTYTDISVTVPTDRWLYVKYVKTGTKFTFYFSEDGEIFEEKGSYTFTSTLFEADGFAVGCGSSQTALPSATIVDLTQTNIKVNGEPIWSCFKQSDNLSFDEKGTDEDYDFFEYKLYGLKYRNYRKGYINNFFVVGSPNIINGNIVSGFSTSNYLVLPENFDVSNGQSWEMVYKVITGSDVSTNQTVTGTNYYRYDPVNITVNGSNFVLDFCSGTSTTIFIVTGTYTVLPNTDYWLKISFDGSTYKLDYSLNGEEFVNDISYSSSTAVYSQPLAIGIQCGGSNGSFSNPFLGSIDLTQCYIKINGELWWQPYKRCKYDYNFTRVGTPSISNAPSCEVSGFSASNCLTIDLPSSITSSEYFFKIKTGDSVTSPTNQLISSHKSPNTWLPAIKSGKICVYNGSWQTGVTSVTPNTTYYVKSVFNGSSWVLYSSTDNESWTTEFTWTTTTSYAGTTLYIGRDYDTTGEYFGGSIDLTQSYIKINGKLWWTCFKQSDHLSFDEKGSDEDYDFITTHPHFIEHDTKNYYKIVPWEQPVLTSDTSYGTLTGGGYSGSRYYYCISDGKIPTTNDASDNWGTNNTAIGWVNWALEEEIIIKGIKIYNRSHTTAVDYTLTGARFYTDSTKTTPIGEEFEILTSQGIYELTTIPEEGIKTNNIYFYKTGSTYSGIGELEITADKKVQSTYNDWDFYEIEEKNIVVYNNKTLKINPTPSNATVTINSEERNEIELMRNSSVSWSVSLDGYKTQSGTLTLSEDTTIDVVLIELQNYTFTINATPSDATVTINGELTNSVTVLEDSEVSYEVSLEGYVTQTGTVVVSEDTVLDVVLEEEKKEPELAYACYHLSMNDLDYYYYAKMPLGSDTTVYCSLLTTLLDAPLVETSAELVDIGTLDAMFGRTIRWSSITETTAYAVNQDSSTSNFSRYYEGDLYE